MYFLPPDRLGHDSKHTIVSRMRHAALHATQKAELDKLDRMIEDGRSKLQIFVLATSQTPELYRVEQELGAQIIAEWLVYRAELVQALLLGPRLCVKCGAEIEEPNDPVE